MIVSRYLNPTKLWDIEPYPDSPYLITLLSSLENVIHLTFGTVLFFQHLMHRIIGCFLKTSRASRYQLPFSLSPHPISAKSLSALKRPKCQTNFRAYEPREISLLFVIPSSETKRRIYLPSCKRTCCSCSNVFRLKSHDHTELGNYYHNDYPIHRWAPNVLLRPWKPLRNGIYQVYKHKYARVLLFLIFTNFDILKKSITYFFLNNDFFAFFHLGPPFECPTPCCLSSLRGDTYVQSVPKTAGRKAEVP